MQPMTAQELIELDSFQLLGKLDEFKGVAIKTGAAWAEAREKYRNLERLSDTKLAEAQRIYFDRSEEMPVSKARAMALTNDLYKNHLAELNKAEGEANLLQAKFAVYKKAIDALTSIGYVRNSELKLGR